MGIINVNYEVASTSYTIGQMLRKLSGIPLLSFDTEVQSVYSQEEIKEAKQLVKSKEFPEYSRDDQKLLKQVAKASGLSNPSLVKVTHFIFGVSEDFSYILISTNPQTEQRIWEWVSNYQGKLVIHNALFDLKIMYNRVQQLPLDYEDTQIEAKCLINDADEFKARVGLKLLMGEYYDPKWTLLDEEGYNSTDYKKESFLNYAAIDGAATFKLYQLLTGANNG